MTTMNAEMRNKRPDLVLINRKSYTMSLRYGGLWVQIDQGENRILLSIEQIRTLKSQFGELLGAYNLKQNQSLREDPQTQLRALYELKYGDSDFWTDEIRKTYKKEFDNLEGKQEGN
jgi:hypothetical protein